MYPIKEQEDKLVYIKEFDFNDDLTDKRLILHFGAVDNKALVYLNDHFIGEHIGGYLAFSFDVTDYISDHNILRVEVSDNTDTFLLVNNQTNRVACGIQVYLVFGKLYGWKPYPLKKK